MTPTTLTQARLVLAEALAGLGIPVHAGEAATAAPPCVLVVPSGPWVTPRGHTTWDVVAVVSAATGWASLEPHVEAIRAALWAAGLAPGDTDQPITDNDVGTISARTEVSLRTTCS